MVMPFKEDPICRV